MKKFSRTCAAAAALLLGVCLCGPRAAAAGEEQLRFPEDGKLKIAVFADLQTTQNVSQNLLDGLEAVLDAEQPDLVLYLGDQVEGTHPLLHLGDNEAHVKRIIDQVLEPVVSRGIPFAVVFGNHDAQDAGVPKETQMAYYRSFPGCLALDEGDALPGCGTYSLLYYSADGSRPALNLYLIDSLEYDEGGGYGCVSREQIAWCRTVGETLTRLNGGRPVPALAFQHIIVPEVYSAFTQVRDKNVEGAFEGRGAGAGRWYTAGPPAVAGALLEAPCPPDYSNGQFAAWLAAGDVKAAFFAHDHLNSFTATLNGIDLTACPGATFTSYGDDAARGVRIIEIDEDEILEGRYETRVLRFSEYYRPGLFAAVQRSFGRYRIWDYALLFLFGALVLANAVFWPLHLRRRRKKRLASAPETAGRKTRGPSH